MLFDMTANSNSRKIMLLNPDYPNDVTLKNTSGTATFSAVIAKKGRPDEYTYQWYVNGAAVAGATGATYVRNVSGDKGKYTVWCDVTNKAGTVRTRNATLTVNKLPVLNASYPQNASETVTYNANFEVKISEKGYPDSYTYQWYVDGKKVSGATKSSYSFTRATEGSATVYCEVTNSVGTVKSRTATLTVNRLYLYHSGNQYSSFTGGWVAARPGPNCADNYVDGFTLEPDHLSINGRKNEYFGGAGTSWLLDLSKHTRLNANASTNSPHARMYVSSRLTDFADSYSIASTPVSMNGDTISLDISNINSGHIAFTAPNTETEGYSTWVTSVWLG